MTTGQKPTGLPGAVTPVSLVETGGSLFQAPSYNNGAPLAGLAGLPGLDRIGAGTPSGSGLVIQLDRPATTALLRGEAVQAIADNPRVVQSISRIPRRSGCIIRSVRQRKVLRNQWISGRRTARKHPQNAQFGLPSHQLFREPVEDDRLGFNLARHDAKPCQRRRQSMQSCYHRSRRRLRFRGTGAMNCGARINRERGTQNDKRRSHHDHGSRRCGGTGRSGCTGVVLLED